MATLDSFFPPGATRGDGRKFTCSEWDDGDWFEPVFKDVDGDWAGLDHGGYHYLAFKNDDPGSWKEWTPPKKTKKVTMYKPVFRGYDKMYVTNSNYEWESNREYCAKDPSIVGWMTLEAEIEVEG